MGVFRHLLLATIISLVSVLQTCGQRVDFNEVYKTCYRGCVYILVVKKDGKMYEGSGFQVNNSFNGNGIIVTNYHVVENAEKIVVCFPHPISYNKNKLDTYSCYHGSVLAIEPANDLALIRIAINGRTILPLLSSGDAENIAVMAIGRNEDLDLGYFTMVDGSVNGENDNDLQHSALIKKGYSGGPLINAQGEVVGVNYKGECLWTKKKKIINNRDTLIDICIPQGISYAKKVSLLRNFLSSQGIPYSIQSPRSANTSTVAPRSRNSVSENMTNNIQAGIGFSPNQSGIGNSNMLFTGWFSYQRYKPSFMNGTLGVGVIAAYNATSNDESTIRISRNIGVRNIYVGPRFEYKRHITKSLGIYGGITTALKIETVSIETTSKGQYVSNRYDENTSNTEIKLDLGIHLGIYYDFSEKFGALFEYGWSINRIGIGINYKLN